MSKKKEIDFSKTINTDDINTALDPLRGVVALLQALELSFDGSHHRYDNYAHYVLGMACNEVIKDFEKMNPKIDYMQDKIREER